MMTQEKLLGRYTILRELGRGAIGAVYAAREQATGATVALKTLDAALLGAADAKLPALFLKNARSAARLRHANIVQVHDAGEAAGTAYVAMELVEGESLRRLLERKPMPIARAIRIFDDIASALAYAHEEETVHRGVRPSNVIVLPSGAAKIGDFGIGQIGEAALRYMSPEQVRGAPVDERSDLFSLGSVLYEMLTRRSPFDGKSAPEIRENILRAKPARPSEVNPLVPAALDAMVLKMLARQPGDRFSNARDLLRELHRLEEGLGLGAAAVTPHDKPATIVPPRRPEPTLAPDADSFHDFAPMQDHDPIHPDPSPADVHHRKLIIDREVFDHHRATMERESRQEPPSGAGRSMFAIGVLALAALGLGFGYVYYLSSPGEQIIAAKPAQAAPMAEAPKEPIAASGAWQATPPWAASNEPAKQASPSAGVRPVAPPPVAKAITEPATPLAPAAAPSGSGITIPPSIAEAPKQSAIASDAPQASPSRAESPVARAPEQPAPTRAAVVQPPPPAKKPAAKVAAPKPATLTIAVSPQAELYIDDKSYGKTLPITTVNLEPGMYRIELRSGSRKPYLTYMTVEAGDVRRITHDFEAKPSRPPA